MPLFRIALLTCLCLFAVSSKAQSLRIAVSETVLSLPLYVAESEGFFKKHGVDVTLQPCLGGVRCMKQMLTGEADMSTATELPVVINSFSHNNFAIVTSFVTTANDIKILVRRDARVKTPLDLKGKKVGYVKSAASQYFLDLALLYHAIDPVNVVLLQTFPESAQRDIESGQVDALSIWEPFAQRILNDNPSTITQLKMPKLYTETFNLMAMRSVIDGQDEQVERVLRALKDSCAFIQSNPVAAKAVLSRRLNTPAILIERTFPDYRYRLSLSQSLVRTMDGQASWAKRERHVDKDTKVPNYLDFIHADILKRIEPTAVSLR